MTRGQLFIISAPSGAGKTTILRRVMAEIPALAFSVSHTTRPPRAGEVAGRDYFFVNRDDFARMQANQEFLESAEVHGNRYGTTLKAVMDQLDSGTDVILDIDVQGARQVTDREEIRPVTVFIVPPSLEELQKRLTGRGTDDEETIRLRLDNATRELANLDLYDHVIINAKLDEAVEMVKAVVLAERSRARRRHSGNPIPVFGSNN
jgi:guanylate kinase